MAAAQGMRLTRLELEEFRCYPRIELEIPRPGLRLYGRNATGKTSLLEAIYLLATMRSPRASQDRDMISWTSAGEFGLPPYARVRGVLVRSEREEQEIEVALTVDERRGEGIRKRVKLDGRPRRALDVVGTLKVVLFAPEDLNLVLGSPSIRRRYLDISVSQVDPTYVRALSKYNRILEQRNSLLKELGARYRLTDPAADEQLAYWDHELITHGAYVIAARQRYLYGLGIAATAAFTKLAGLDAPLTLQYVGTMTLPEAQENGLITSTPGDTQSLVARTFETDLVRLREDELRRGVTLVGPHRDDFMFLLGGHDLAAYGSRGQQRLAVVATKLGELQQIIVSTGTRPILMLDDVLSELDPERQERLLKALGPAECQILITTTDRTLLDQASLGDLPFYATPSISLEPEEPAEPPF
jgi:DNA replication and repair protein RecF